MAEDNGCDHCTHWEREANREPVNEFHGRLLQAEPVTSLKCPVCDRSFIALERTARLVNGMGDDYWADARAMLSARKKETGT
jgi:hypothetical protein